MRFLPRKYVLITFYSKIIIQIAFKTLNLTLPVFVDDIDGEKNGSFQSETLQVNFKDAVHRITGMKTNIP